MAVSQFEIKQTLLVFQEDKEYHKELNLISWFGNSPKYDIRGWNDDRSKMTKGISLTQEEFDGIIKAYQEGRNEN